MIKSSYLEGFARERERKVIQEDILTALSVRFDSVPDELAREVQTETRITRLRELIRPAVQCRSLTAFQKRLKEIKGQTSTRKPLKSAPRTPATRPGRG